MFNLFKKKGHVLGAPTKGKAVPLSEVNDPTFAEEMLGKGAAVIPSEGKIYAPADGEIGMVFDRSMRRPTERSEWYSIHSMQSAWLRISAQRC